MNKAFYRFAKSMAGLILTFNVLALVWVIVYAFCPVPITTLMVLEKQSKDIHYQWVDLTEISDNVQLAVMCAEDQYFLLHNGIDFQSIERAIESNREGNRVKGASTLTQQVAKNAFLWPDRHWMRKGAELYFSLLIEMVWSKERIMEVYLNVAELGDGIFGVEAASKAYFKKPASKLTKQEAALLAAVLPSPKRYSASNPGPYVQRRVRWIMGQMKHWGGEMTYDGSILEEMKR